MKFTAKLMLVFATIILLCFPLIINKKSQCDLENLIMQDDMLPTAWKRVWRVLPPALPKMGARDALGVVYENGNEIAQHKIFQYRNTMLSSIFMRINKEYFFPSGSWTWFELEGSDDWELFGDEEKIRCGDSNEPLFGNRCVSIIRHGLFISYFSSSVGEGVMSEEEFKKIVIIINEHIASCQK